MSYTSANRLSIHCTCCVVTNHTNNNPMRLSCIRSVGWFNIKMSSYQYRKSHCRDKMIWRPFYLHNAIYYTSKMTCLYWIRAQIDAQCLINLILAFIDWGDGLVPSGNDLRHIWPRSTTQYSVSISQLSKYATFAGYYHLCECRRQGSNPGCHLQL